MEHRSDKAVPLLIKHLSRLPKGKALDVACGYGRNALYLASAGFSVLGLDRNQEAVDFCKKTADQQRLNVSAQCVDLEKDLSFKPDADAYALVSCFYYLDRQIIPQMKQALRVGGILVYETFLIDQHEKYGKPSRKAFCWAHNELLRLFLDFRILHYYEGQIDDSGEVVSDHQGRWVVQLIAERLR